MASRSELAAAILAAAPPFPLAEDCWQAVIESLRLSKQQAAVTEYVMRDLSTKQITIVMGIKEGTVKEYLKRAFDKAGAHSQKGLISRVMAVSHQVNGNGRRPIRNGI